MPTDAQLLQGIVNELKTNPALHYTRLDVLVNDGAVTISGRVNSFAERKAVERAAKRVAGVKILVLEIGAAAVPATIVDTRMRAHEEIG